MVLQKRVFRRIYGPRKDEVTRVWRNHIMRSLMICTPHQTIFG
jgi:hypothetical protein